MKKKNVVKRTVREKKTHTRTPIRIIREVRKEETKPVEEFKPVVVEKETVKKQNRKPKPAPVETVPMVDNNIENNEQNS